MLNIVLTLIPLMGITLVCPVISVHLPKKKARLLIGAALIVYIGGNLYITLLSRSFDKNRYIELRPLIVYTRLFVSQLNPPSTQQGLLAILQDKTLLIWGVILNILLYYPLGYLLPILFPKVKPKQIIIIGILCSIATEAMQFFFKIGWCETDDVIHNTLGTAIGVWVWLLQVKRKQRRK